MFVLRLIPLAISVRALASPNGMAAPVARRYSERDRGVPFARTQRAGREIRMASITQESSSRPAIREPKPRRRFRVSDAMILVAATAAGFGMVRAYLSQEAVWLGFSTEMPTGVLDGSFMASKVVPPFLGSWTVALILLRLSGPRPRFRRLVRQPGLIAGFAATLALAIITIPAVIIALSGGWDGLGLFILTTPKSFLYHASLPGLLVLASWLTLAATESWRAEPGWVDRSGRVLGIAWMGLSLASLGVVAWDCCQPPAMPVPHYGQPSIPIYPDPDQPPPVDSPFRQPDPKR
jgi:hypothetical protein